MIFVSLTWGMVLIMMYLSILFFMTLVCGVCYAFWNCVFLIFIKLEDFFHPLLNIFSVLAILWGFQLYIRMPWSCPTSCCCCFFPLRVLFRVDFYYYVFRFTERFFSIPVILPSFVYKMWLKLLMSFVSFLSLETMSVSIDCWIFTVFLSLLAVIFYCFFAWLVIFAWVPVLGNFIMLVVYILYYCYNSLDFFELQWSYLESIWSFWDF